MTQTNSKGLDFLKKHRAEWTRSMLTFLGESAQHLDPKTKYLEYVMLQTITGNHRGLKFYIQKALKHASCDEVIDTILVSYPACGLGKVIDAIDVLQQEISKNEGVLYDGDHK